MLAISADTIEDAANYERRLSAWFPVLHDPELGVIEAYGVLESEHELAIPAVVFVDQRGQVIFRKMGEAKNDRVYAEDLLMLIDREFQVASRQ